MPADTGSSAIEGYRIDVSSDSAQNWTTLATGLAADRTTYKHTGLQPGTTRHYQVFAINAVGTGPASNVAHAKTEGDDTAEPGPPRDLEATADGDSAIDLTWTAPVDSGSSSIFGYQVEVSGDGGTSWAGLVFTTATLYKHSQLGAGTTRHYRVSARNATGVGGLSNVAYATTDAEAAKAPGPPRNLVAAADGGSAIDLSWTAPVDSGSSSIIGYQIEVSSDGGTSWVDLGFSTAIEYKHNGLGPGTTWHYRVFARNAAGRGDPSGAASARTDANAPGAPTGLVAAAQGQTQINLSWTAPADDGGSAITGYRIEVSGDGGAWTTLAANANSSAATYSHLGLSPATTRHYRVSAINEIGTGPASDLAHATTEGTVPDAPVGLKASAQGTSQTALLWTAPAYGGGSPVTGYRILVSSEADPVWTTLVDNTGSASTTYTHTHLDPGTTWHYRVRAINAAGAGPESNTASGTTEATLPGPPAEVSAVAGGPLWIEVSWKPPAFTGGAPVTGYQIEVYNGGNLPWTVLVADTRNTATQYHHLGLDPGTTRRYRVSAITSVGTGAASRVASATTDPVVPDAPTELTATANGASRIDLAWRPPDYEGGAPVTGYRIEVFEGGSSPWRVLVDDTRSTASQYAHNGLDPASTRTYRVSAINAAGVGNVSDMASATTDPVVPGVPGELTATANGTSRVDLAWRAPDHDGGAPITGYRIEVSEHEGATWATLVLDTRSSATAFPHVNLPPATTRHYRVSAINRAGTGEPSNVAFATTDATVPDPPARLNAVAKDHSQIDLSWTAPNFDGGSRIAGYRIEVSEDAGVTWTDQAANTGSTNTRYSHTGLRPVTTRHYRVSAINEIGTGVASNVAHATTDAITPDPPTNLVAAAAAPTRIELSWTAPAYDGGAPVTGYRIEVSEDGTAWADLVASTGTDLTAYAHTGLRPGSTRHYRVSAINIAGTGQPSNVASATTDDPVQRAGRVNEAVLPHFAAAMTTSTLSAISGRIEAVASSNSRPSPSRAAGLLSRLGDPGLRRADGTLNTGRLFNGVSFARPLGGGAQDAQAGPGSRLGVWGAAEHHRMGEPGGDEVRWEGDMVSVHAGVDMRVHRDFLVGLAGSRSSGNYDFTDVTGAREVAGTYEARMNSVNPYLAWLPGRKGMAVWAVGSFGQGEVAVDDEIAGRRASNARIMTGGLGGSRFLLADGLSSLRVRSEGWMSRVQVDAAEGMDSLTLEMLRARVAVEWSQRRRFEGGHEVNLMLEGGMRYDDGDGSEGVGMEFGGGLRYTSPSRALTMEGHGRVLATGSSGYEEWGVRGRIEISPQGDGGGLSLRLVPVWGEAASGVRELWERGVSGRPGQSQVMQRGRLNAELAYDLPAFHGTPYGRLQVTEGGGRTLGTGMRYEVKRILGLSLEGTRTESTGGPPRHRLAVKGAWRFGPAKATTERKNDQDERD